MNGYQSCLQICCRTTIIFNTINYFLIACFLPLLFSHLCLICIFLDIVHILYFQIGHITEPTGSWEVSVTSNNMLIL